MNGLNSVMVINELILLEKYNRAQELCDQNVLMLRDKIDQFQNLFVHAEDCKIKKATLDARPLDELVREEELREAGNL